MLDHILLYTLWSFNRLHNVYLGLKLLEDHQHYIPCSVDPKCPGSNCSWCLPRKLITMRLLSRCLVSICFGSHGVLVCGCRHSLRYLGAGRRMCTELLYYLLVGSILISTKGKFCLFSSQNCCIFYLPHLCIGRRTRRESCLRLRLVNYLSNLLRIWGWRSLVPIHIRW